ncbi:MAG: hypothetical protein NVSMB18_34690 [Acetobacteraceae bacterium]
MSSRRADTPEGKASFDHGAQYFTVRDPAFRAQVEAWGQAGFAAPWPAAGPDAWVGTPAMNAPVQHMAGRLDVHVITQIDSIESHAGQWLVAERAFDAAIIATAAEQAVPLLRPWHADFADLAAATPSAPCWTVMAAFADRLPYQPDIVRDAGPIGWAARNSAKAGRTGPESWVLQATPDWSRTHLERDPASIAAVLLGAFAEHTGITVPSPLIATAHRWRYARSGVSGDAALWDPGLQFGVCGDWLLGPRVEAAYLSGIRLAALITATASPGTADAQEAD